MKKCRNSLKAARKGSGLTLHALSAETGVPVSTINNFENGLRSIDDDALRRILEVLQVDVAAIVEKDDYPEPRSGEHIIREPRGGGGA